MQNPDSATVMMQQLMQKQHQQQQPAHSSGHHHHHHHHHQQPPPAHSNANPRLSNNSPSQLPFAHIKKEAGGEYCSFLFFVNMVLIFVCLPELPLANLFRCVLRSRPSGVRTYCEFESHSGAKTALTTTRFTTSTTVTKTATDESRATASIGNSETATATAATATTT